jgi:hypothetical protein
MHISVSSLDLFKSMFLNAFMPSTLAASFSVLTLIASQTRGHECIHSLEAGVPPNEEASV